MDLESLKKTLAKIEAEAQTSAQQSDTIDALRSAETRLTKGPLAEALKSIKSFPADQRGQAGMFINETKQAVIGLFIRG